MACENLVSVKNILLTFYDCNTDTRVGPISHELATEELPTVKSSRVMNERLTGGYIKRTVSDARIAMTVVRDLRLPLAYYQGDVAIDSQIEYDNGLVYTGLNGGVIGDESSDTHEVALDLTYKTLDELLPVGSLVAA